MNLRFYANKSLTLPKKLYGKSSEKRDYNQNQLSLFDDMELPEEESDCPR